MIKIEKLIIHVLNCETNLLVLSDECMKEYESTIEKMLYQKLNKIFTSSGKRRGEFKDNSHVKGKIEDYKSKTISFEELSAWYATYVFDIKMKYGIYENSDLIICEVLYEERRYIVTFENSYNEGITHYIQQEDDIVKNEIITQKTLISQNLLKKDYAITIELSDLQIGTIESAVEIEGETTFLYSNLILSCEMKTSFKEGTKAIQKVCKNISEKYNLDDMQMMPKVKQMIVDSVDSKTDIEVEEIATILFSDKPMVKTEFKEELHKSGVHAIPVEYAKTTKAEKMQKIKTDIGIEISVPVDFMNSKEYIEFSTAVDGTISIQLKNINKLISK